MQNFSERVLAWSAIYGRKKLPWQQNSSIYKTWISEIMLQQTQVATVIPYFNRFIEKFPTITELANATQDDVLSHWAGLGYYSRARNLHKTAKIIRDEHNSIFPNDIKIVISLSGIGQSTAGAILSLSLSQRHAILDGNVKRVLSRHRCIDGIPNQSATLKKQWEIAELNTPHENCDQYTQAMMDLGATICTRTKPKCNLCPVHVDCRALQSKLIEQYPNKKPKKKLPEKTTAMLIITDGPRTFLEKRPDKGIWGGLWSLPEIETASIKNTNAFLSANDFQEIKRRELSIYTHVFTHYKLHITPVIIEVEMIPINQGFTDMERQKIGLPAPIQKILESLYS